MPTVINMGPNPNLGDYFGRGLVQGLQSRYDLYQEQEKEKQRQQREQEQMKSEMGALKEATDAAGDDFASKLNAVLQAPVSNATKAMAANFLKMEQDAKEESSLQKYLQNFYGQNEGATEDQENYIDPEAMQQNQSGLAGALSAANGSKGQMSQGQQEPEETEIPTVKTPPHLKSRIGKKFPEADILRFAKKPQMQKQMREHNKVIEGREKEEREYARKRAEPVIEEAENLRGALRQKGNALKTVGNAAMTGDLGFWSGDNLADLTGYEALRTMKGAQLKTALKDYYISTISKIRAKGLNQYIEGQINDMLPKIGRSRSANLGTYHILNFEKDMEQLYVDTVDQLEDYYDSIGQPLPKKFGREVQKVMDEKASVLEKNLERQLRLINKYEKEINEMPKNHIFMIDPAGNPMLVPEDEEQEALKLKAERI